MAISFVRNSTQQDTTTSTLTYAFDCTSSDFLIVSCLSANDSAGQFTVKYNGVSMTNVIDAESSTGTNFLSIFVLHAPASGSNNIVVTSTSGSQRIRTSAICYLGVNQADSVDASGTSGALSSGSAGNATMSLTVSSNTWIVSTSNEDGASSHDSLVSVLASSRGSAARTAFADSNGALSAGSNLFGYHFPGAYVDHIIAIAIKPPPPPVNAGAFLNFF